MKKLVSFLILATSLVSLTACGGKNDDNTTAQNDNNERGNTSQMTYSEYFSQSKRKPQIWYDAMEDSDGLGKQSKIMFMYVFKDNKVTRYERLNLKLGDVAKMDDADIISTAKKQTMAAYTNLFDEKIIEVEDSLNNAEQNAGKGNTYAPLYSKWLAELKKTKVAEPQPAKISFAVFTDNSGNNTAIEQIRFTLKGQELARVSFENSKDGEVVSTKMYDDDKILDFNGPSVLSGVTIYDAKYITIPSAGGKRYMMCRDEKLPALIFDEPDSKNVEVDPDN